MSTATEGAKRKGREARQSNQLRSDCPYVDWRTHRGSVTWSRAFERAWYSGWDDQDAIETKKDSSC